MNVLAAGLVHDGLVHAANTTVLAAQEVSGGEAFLFWILGPISLIGAIGMVLSRNAIHSALWLVLTMLSLGIFYFVQQGPFIGAVQIIVYTGAIMILFLFVLMLIGRDTSDSLVETLRGQRVSAIVVGVAFGCLVGATVARSVIDSDVTGLDAANRDGGNVSALARLIFTDYLFAFELTSALLITAAVGAMVLAHIERDRKDRLTQKARARARFRSARPGPLPGPGVFATSHSIATPALLPDGSVAPESVPAGLEVERPLERWALEAAQSGNQSRYQRTTEPEGDDQS